MPLFAVGDDVMFQGERAVVFKVMRLGILDSVSFLYALLPPDEDGTPRLAGESKLTPAR